MQANARCPMCRGQIAEDKLVEVPPDYEANAAEQNDEESPADQPFCSSSKVFC